jgi:hypothetical protein
MDIASAMDRIVAIELGLSISQPVAVTVKRAYKYPPAMNVALPSTPAWVNTWTLTRYQRMSGKRTHEYAVNAQLHVEDANQDRAAEIATNFYVAFIAALDADVTLNHTAVLHTPRGGDPTLVLFERAGKGYVGLNLFLDLFLEDATQFS